MDDCGHVKMDRYWNFVAVPTFISTMLFGLYVLFTTDEVQMQNATQLHDAIGQMKRDRIAAATANPAASTTPKK